MGANDSECHQVTIHFIATRKTVGGDAFQSQNTAFNTDLRGAISRERGLGSTVSLTKRRGFVGVCLFYPLLAYPYPVDSLLLPSPRSELTSTAFHLPSIAIRRNHSHLAVDLHTVKLRKSCQVSNSTTIQRGLGCLG
jgi:hypothetical protein